MGTYIIRRLIQSVFVLLIVTWLVFLGVRLLPGDPILMLITQDDLQGYSEERVALLKHEFGLDKPIMIQYGKWLLDVFRGDLGVSILDRTSVTSQIGRRLPITLHLGFLAFLISIIIGIPAGVISAIRWGGWLDTVITLLTYVGITIPIFWLGILLVYLFALELNLLPAFGYISPFVDFWGSTKRIIMPVFCLSIFAMEVLRQDYIRTARAKGLRERLIILRHALKNGLIPVVTLKGMTLRNIIGGSVLVETVFNIPGMGRLAVDAIFSHDYAIVQGVVLIIAIVVMISNLLVDLSYGWLDPRIRFG
jgi:peptide/nickel transport system permease protein